MEIEDNYYGYYTCPLKLYQAPKSSYSAHLTQLHLQSANKMEKGKHNLISKTVHWCTCYHKMR
jgi:hypothetical protein